MNKLFQAWFCFLAATVLDVHPAPSIPPGARVIQDLVYREVEGSGLKLDLYLPAAASKPAPLIIWIHGGAWKSGSKDSSSPALTFLNEGFAVAHVGYRFSQQARWPAQIEDCQAAVDYLRRESSRLGLDPRRFVAWGASAGGHLAAFLGTGYHRSGKLESQLEPPRVQAVVDWFGPTDFLEMDRAGSSMKHDSPDSPESQLIGGAIQSNREGAMDANPAFHLSKFPTAKVPPFLIMHGTEDKIVPFNQSEILHQALKGRDVAFVPIKGAGHGFSGEAPVDIVRGFLARVILDPTRAESRGLDASPWSIFGRSNLVAWCIVPFDSRKRGPQERAGMLKKLEIPMFAYDYRAEHIPTFDAELNACKKEGIELMAWWFPGSLNEEARGILEVLKKHGVRAQLWVTGGGDHPADEAGQKMRVRAEADRIEPIARAAAGIGCTVGLYNHGSWFGEPTNQVLIIHALQERGVANVGIVYNLHHGHSHLERFEELLKLMKPHLMTLNLNGMAFNGDRTGKKILPIGQGELDTRLIQVIARSGWRGPVGILNHTDEDAEARLRDNLEGLEWCIKQARGIHVDAKPVPKSWKPAQ